MGSNPTGGTDVVYDPNNSGGGDVGECASLSDFVNDSPRSVTAATYNGNIPNFHYPLEDALAKRAAPNDKLGANYFQASSGGQFDGFRSLSAYAANPANRNYEIPGF